MNDWSSFAPGFSLRRYQEPVLERFEKLREEGARKFHLVAPPGSGKTLLGLQLAWQLEEKTICLSPTSAIQHQWVDRLRSNFHCLDSTQEAFTPHIRAGASLESDETLLSWTYQSLLSPRFDAQVSQIKDAGFKTIILDECHHLAGAWGVAIEQLIQSLDNPFVIALTATPIENERCYGLYGAPDYVIDLPPVVCSGDLAPFQELCLTVSPSPEEEKRLSGSAAELQQAIQVLDSPFDEGFSLTTWCEAQDIEPTKAAGGKYEDLHEFLESEPDLFVSICRWRNEKSGKLPLEVPELPEFLEPPSLTDKLEVLSAYLSRYRLQSANTKLTAEVEKALETLENWGYRVSRGRVQRSGGKYCEWLSASQNKLSALAEILRFEKRHMGTDLRALILTDFESPPASRPGLSCVDVVQLLANDHDLDELNPVMVTGNSLLVDDDLWPEFEREGKRLLSEVVWEGISKNTDRGTWRVEGKGANWNSQIRVQLVTHLLESGASNCIVGTRALLGEGWDCPAVNTLIDLCGVGAPVAVNQMRGRSLRRLEDDPTKVANNWDILCISASGAQHDLQRLRRKHENLFGLCRDGRIQNGLDRIHPAFDSESPIQILSHLEEINAETWLRAQTRQAARQAWEKNSNYADSIVSALTITRSSVAPRQTKKSSAKTSTSLAPYQPDSLAPPRLKTWRSRLGIAGLLGIAAGAIAAPLGTGAIAFAAFTLAGAAFLGNRLLNRTIEARPWSETIRELAYIVQQADSPSGDRESSDISSIECTTRSGGSIRVLWTDSSSANAEDWSRALDELLSPIARPRYVLVEREKRKSAPRVFAVPRRFASKEKSQRLLTVWKNFRNPKVKVFHTKSEQGKELLKLARHRRPFELDVKKRKIWQ